MFFLPKLINILLTFDRDILFDLSMWSLKTLDKLIDTKLAIYGIEEIKPFFFVLNLLIINKMNNIFQSV